MRHLKAGKKLSRNSSHRKAMFRNMVTSLFKYEQLETTDAKAKALKQTAEHMITLAKRGDLHARRQALAYMKDKHTTHRLFEELKDRYGDRQGGYIRIVKKTNRKGDGAPISVVQLLPEEEGKKKSKKKMKTTSTKPKNKKEVKVKTAPDELKEKKETKTKSDLDKPKQKKEVKKKATPAEPTVKKETKAKSTPAKAKSKKEIKTKEKEKADQEDDG